LSLLLPSSHMARISEYFKDISRLSTSSSRVRHGLGMLLLLLGRLWHQHIQLNFN
jgi:hypothetical protein